MAFNSSLDHLVDLLHATPVSIPHDAEAVSVTGISTDSRSIQPGQVFLALRGDSFDGHGFVKQAFEQGAIAAIVDGALVEVAECPQLVVADTLVAYQQIGRWWRDQFAIPVIAVTGSVGKTTTKELIAAVLSQHGRVHKSAANYNNEIGVPKTLLELAPGQDFAIVEMGMRAMGEIALLTQIARPDIAVITNVGTAHIGRLGSEAAIAQAKCELLAELAPTGVAILNHDNPLLLKTAEGLWQGQTLTFGLTGGDIRGEWGDGKTLRVRGLDLPLPLPGQHNALNYLAAIAVAEALKLDWSSLTQGLTVILPGGRARRYDLPEDVVILDETYNAGLESMLAAIKLLAQTPGQRRIAVLGTMKELGDRSLEFHYQVGVAVHEHQLDALLILADAAEGKALAAGAAPLVAETFLNQELLVDRLTQLVQPGDRLLFKASRAVGLDRVVDCFRATSKVA